MKWRWAAVILTGLGSALIIGAAILAGFIYFHSKSASAEPLLQPGAVLAVDNPAPDFQLETLEGKLVSLSGSGWKTCRA